MRRLEYLIEDSRRETENDEFTADAGIQDEEFIRYANDAQQRLQSKIFRKSEKVFTAEKIINTVARQEAYDLPVDILWDNAVSQVDITLNTSGLQDFFPLDQGVLKERNTLIFGDPQYYIRLGGQILLNPIPNSGSKRLRINYIRRLDKLDIRRATVSAVTLGAGNTITSLTLDTSQFLDRDTLVKENMFSVVNSDGDQNMRMVRFTDINATTGVVTIDPSFAYEDGETLSVGDYIVAGFDSANRSEMPTSLERYLIGYMNWKALKRDSSADAREMQEELLVMETEILESFSDVDDDIHRIPVISHRMIIDEEII